MKIKKFLLPIFLLLSMMVGCKEVLISDLNETDANEVLQTLLIRGIDAKKERANKNGFEVLVEHKDLVRSLEILKEHSLPREKFQSLGSIFSNQNMISSQTEELARLSFAISQELSATFSRIDGVLDARVHVVLVQHDQASNITTAPSAAVFIRHIETSPIVNMISGIKETVARSVPGLTLDRVSVLTEVFKENFIKPTIIEQKWYEKSYVIAILGIFSLITILGLIFIIFYIKGFRFIKKV